MNRFLMLAALLMFACGQATSSAQDDASADATEQAQAESTDTTTDAADTEAAETMLPKVEKRRQRRRKMLTAFPSPKLTRRKTLGC